MLQVIKQHKKYELCLATYNGKVVAAYLNDYRISGSKPPVGSNYDNKMTFTLNELLKAVPELQGQFLPTAV